MPSSIEIAILAAVLWLACANGANDIFKGVATLFGSGRMSYRAALSWASLTTVAGSLMALLLAKGLVARFSGRNLVPDALASSPAFALSVAASAAATVLLATRMGLPVSTTHALMGGLVGAGLAADPSTVRFETLGTTFALPLLASPLAALGMTASIYGVGSRVRRRSGLRADSCICFDAPAAFALPPGAAAVSMAGAVVVAHRSGCPASPARILGITARRLLDFSHALSAGAVGFARGLNDTPKIVALLTTASFAGGSVIVAVVASAMLAGGIAGARRVAQTMSTGITTMNEGQGFAANLVTSSLVLAASAASLPVSTTHVSVGALFGIGAATGELRRRAIGSIVLAWLVTAPLAATLAAASWIVSR
jgi:PiT family inorganic phosphate transporter